MKEKNNLVFPIQSQFFFQLRKKLIIKTKNKIYYLIFQYTFLLQKTEKVFRPITQLLLWVNFMRHAGPPVMGLTVWVSRPAKMAAAVVRAPRWKGSNCIQFPLKKLTLPFSSLHQINLMSLHLSSQTMHNRPATSTRYLLYATGEQMANHNMYVLTGSIVQSSSYDQFKFPNAICNMQ